MKKTGAYLFQPDEFFNILFEENIDILSSDGTAAAFNTQKTADLLKEYKQYTDQGVIPKNNWGSWDESLKLFESGKLAIVSSSGSSLSRIKDEAPDILQDNCCFQATDRCYRSEPQSVDESGCSVKE